MSVFLARPRKIGTGLRTGSLVRGVVTDIQASMIGVARRRGSAGRALDISRGIRPAATLRCESRRRSVTPRGVHQVRERQQADPSVLRHLRSSR